MLLASAPVLAGTKARVHLLFSGIAFVALFMLMLQPELSMVRGLLQRTADVLLGGAILVIAWQLLAVRRSV
jgi:hypothetical protein